MFLADVGTGAYTSYEVDKGAFKAVDIIDLHTEFPGLSTGECKAHHIHTHHNMSAFFSGTDDEQMNDRGQLSNYLLMLIVNFKGDWIAKVGFPGKVNAPARRVVDPQTISFLHNLDGYSNMILEGTEKDESQEKECMILMDCIIVKEAMDERQLTPFQERYFKVLEACRPIPATSFAGGNSYSPGRIYPSNTPNWPPQQTQEKAPDTRGKPWSGSVPSSSTNGQTIDGKQKPREFDNRHARAYINAVLDYPVITQAPMDFREPIGKISQLVMQSTPQLNAGEGFISDMIDNMFDWLSYNFEGVTDEEQLSFIEVLIDYLFPYSTHHKTVRKLLGALREEMKVVYRQAEITATLGDMKVI